MLVNGALGGVGHLAVQFARWRGAHVVAAVSPGNLDGARSLGAHEVFERTADLESALEPVDLVFEQNRAQLAELTRLVDAGRLRPTIDSVFPLDDVRAAFERSGARSTRGKVVLRVADE